MTGSLALIFLSVTMLVTGATAPPRQPGVIIAIAHFANAPTASDPVGKLTGDILGGANASGLSQVTVRQSGITPLTPSQAQSERARLSADILIWGDFGPAGAITANVTLAPAFSTILQPWQQYSDPDPDLLLLPSDATFYIPAGHGLDTLVPLSMALVYWKSGSFAAASDAAWGAQATLDANGGSSPTRFPSILQANSLVALGKYSDARATIDDIETAGALTPLALLIRSNARLLLQDYAGASDDANRVIDDRDSPNLLLSRAFLVRGRARYNTGDLSTALDDLNTTSRLDPTLLRVHLDRAETYYRQAQPTFALAQLDTLIKAEPTAVTAYRLSGLVRLMLGQPDVALDPLGKARALYTSWITAQRKDEAQAESLGDTARAHTASDNIVTLNKGLAGIALYEGMAYADTARTEQQESFLAGLWRGIRGEPSITDRAISKMQEAARLDPHRPDVPLQLGSLYTSLKQYDSAEQNLKLAQSLDPSLPEPYMALAHLQESMSRPADAIATLEDLVSRLPTHYPAYDYLNKLYASSGDAQSAQDALQRALAVPAQTPTDHLWHGKFLLALQRPDDAIPELQSAATDPELWEAHLLLGNVYLDKGRGPDALAQYQAVLAVQPNNEAALLNAGKLLVLAGNADDAQTLFERLTAVVPSNVDGHIALLQLLLSRGQLDSALAEGGKAVAADPSRADAYFYLGVAYEAREDWPHASVAYQSSTQRDPTDFQSFLNWSRSLYNRDLYTDSLSVAKQASALRPDDPQPYRWQAQSQLALGDTDGALANLAQALDLHSDDPDALALTSRVYLARGDAQTALQYARQAVQASASNPAAMLSLGEVQLALNDSAGALQSFGTALEVAVQPRDVALALTGQGRAYALAGNRDKAFRSYTTAAQRDPMLAEPFLYAGNLFADAGQTADALKQYRQAVSLRPNWPLALYYLGMTYLQNRDLANAQGAFAKAVQYSPSMYQAWFGLGLAQRDGNQAQAAVKSLQKATTLNPAYPEAWLYLGLTLEETGDRAGASSAFTQAYDTATTDAIRQQATEGLGRVK
jgi:tetratricopeptide (TPR) repeat protein